eukprot:1156246-Pelagomonas_calceolata.AAC.4
MPEVCELGKKKVRQIHQGPTRLTSAYKHHGLNACLLCLKHFCSTVEACKEGGLVDPPRSREGTGTNRHHNLHMLLVLLKCGSLQGRGSGGSTKGLLEE